MLREVSDIRPFSAGGLFCHLKTFSSCLKNRPLGRQNREMIFRLRKRCSGLEICCFMIKSVQV
ncbi:hypothetical protein CKX33_06855 [Neisseria gonorrhoeae]|nr:hypothetical protein CA773_08850 [Neisseria gonorrhoeae]PAX28460.1 hypothetical protein CKX33_06855 [Neisseria gonorrhoeae]